MSEERPKPDYYGILGVSSAVSERELKRVFRALVKIYHPDPLSDASKDERKHAEERFKEINNAYEVLSDPEKRREYDAKVAQIAKQAERERAEEKSRRDKDSKIIRIRDLYESGDIEGAVSEAESLFRSYPDDADFQNQYAALLYEWGKNLAKKRRFGEAKTQLRKAANHTLDNTLKSHIHADLELLDEKDRDVPPPHTSPSINYSRSSSHASPPPPPPALKEVSQQKIFIVLAIAVVVGIAAISQLHTIPQSNRVASQPPRIWAAQENPTRIKSVPSDLSFAPDGNGNYQWVETIRPGDDVQINFEPNWSFTWNNSIPESSLDSAMRRTDGTYFIPNGANNSCTAIRFRIKPGIQLSDDINLKMTRLPGFNAAATRINDWPINWMPTRSVSEPNTDAPIGTIQEEYFKPGGVLEIKLESPEYELRLDEHTVRSCYIKYGDDVSCWSYSKASKYDANPPQIHGFLRVRFKSYSPVWLSSEDVKVRFLITKSSPGLFLKTELPDPAPIPNNNHPNNPYPTRYYPNSNNRYAGNARLVTELNKENTTKSYRDIFLQFEQLEASVLGSGAFENYSRGYPFDFDKVWNTTINVLKQQADPISNSNHEKGLILTDLTRHGLDGFPHYDRYIIMVQRLDDNHTRIIVKLMSYWVDFSHNQAGIKRPEKSDHIHKCENDFLERIVQELNAH